MKTTLLSEEAKPSIDMWAVVELLGHVKLAGRVTEVEMFGGKMGRLDIYSAPDKQEATQFFGAGSVYRISACTAELACAITNLNQHSWRPPTIPTPLMIGVPAHDEIDDDERGGSMCLGCGNAVEACRC